MFCGGADCVIKVEFICRPVAGPAAQAFERDFDVAGADFNRVVKIAELAFVPDFNGALVAAGVLADAHAFWVVAIGPEGRCASRADPFGPTLMAALLLFEPLFERFHQFVKAAKRVDFSLFLCAKMLFSHLFQPVLGNVDGVHDGRIGNCLQAFKGGGEGAIKLVDVAFVFDHAGAREKVERVYVVGGDASFHAFKERQEFPQGNGDAAPPKGIKERQKHQARLRVIMIAINKPIMPKIIANTAAHWAMSAALPPRDFARYAPSNAPKNRPPRG